MNILIYGINIPGSNINHLHFGSIAQKHKNFFLQSGYKITTFGISDADINFSIGEDILSILKKLQWEPDFVLIQGPEYLFFPLNLHLCPYPLVFATCDFDYEILRSIPILKIADLVITFSDETLKFLKSAGIRNIIKFPIWCGFRFSSKEIKPLYLRTIDIFYSGNLDPFLFPERGKLILEIIKASERLGLKFKLSNKYLDPKTYEDFLLNSKFVITYHRRKEFHRPEAILAGSILITNSEEFSNIFVKNEDFIIYNDLQKIDHTIKEALSLIHSQHNQRERIERILSLRQKFLPEVRLLEMIETVKQNLDKAKEQTLKRLEIYKKNKTIGKFLNTLYLDQVIDIYGLSPKSKKYLSKINSELLKDLENEISGHTLQEITRSEVAPQIYINSKKVLSLYLSPENLPTSPPEIFEMLTKNSDQYDFILPANLAVFELNRFNFEIAYTLSDLALQRFLIAKNNPEKVTEIIKSTPFICSIVPVQEIYFPDLRYIYIKENTDNLLLNIENSLKFIKAYILYYVSLYNSQTLRYSLSIFEDILNYSNNWHYQFIYAKALIKNSRFSDAFKALLKSLEKSISYKSIELLSPFIVTGKISELNIEDLSINFSKLLSIDQEGYISDILDKTLDKAKHGKNVPSEIPDFDGIYKQKFAKVLIVNENIQTLDLTLKFIRWNLFPYTDFIIISPDKDSRKIIDEKLKKHNLNNVSAKFAKNIKEAILNELQIHPEKKVFLISSNDIIAEHKIFFDISFIDYLKAILTPIGNNFMLSGEAEIIFEFVKSGEIKDFYTCKKPGGFSLAENKIIKIHKEEQKLKILFYE